MSPLSTAITNAEVEFATLLATYANPRAWEWRHPFVALRMARLVRELPVIDCHLSSSRIGLAMRSQLYRCHGRVHTALH